MASSIGVLLLHGWTSSAENYRELLPEIRELGLPLRAPTYRGHGLADAALLKNMNWRQWLEDAENAFHELITEAESVVIVGHSMGGMLALQLAAKHPDKIAGLVLAGPACQTGSVFGPGRPLHFVAPLLALFLGTLKFKPAYIDSEQVAQHPGYNQVPVEAVVQLFECIKAARKGLSKVRVPLLILHSTLDQLALPQGAYEVFEKVATPEDQKELRWFDEGGHEMFLDYGREKVNEAVLGFIESCRNGHQGG